MSNHRQAFDNWIKPFLNDEIGHQNMKFEQAKETVTPFMQSLTDIGLEPYTPQYNEIRDDLAELIQAVHQNAWHEAFDKGHKLATAGINKE